MPPLFAIVTTTLFNFDGKFRLNRRKAWCLSLKKQSLRPGTFLRTALANAFPAISRE
jgi:hypothetical protein